MWSQIWLIVRKDLRRIRWVLLIFAMLLVVGAAVTAWGPWKRTEARALWDSLFPLIPWLLGAVATAMVVHEDALVGTREQWMTRPLRPTAVFLAKALLLVGCFALLPALADTALLGYFGLEPSRWASATVHGSLSYAEWLLAASAIAAVTSGMAAYLVAAVAALISMTISAIVAASLGPEVQVGNLTGEKCAYVLLAVFVYVIARQYRRSGTLGSRIVLAVGLLAAPFAMLIRLPESPPPSVELVGPPLEASLAALPAAKGQSKSQVNVRFSAESTSPEMALELRGVRGEIVLESGPRLPFENPYDDVAILQGQIVNLDAALRAALPGYAWSGPRRTNERFTNLFLWSDTGLSEAPAGTHALTARGQIQSHRFELSGKLPLRTRSSVRSNAIAVWMFHVDMNADEVEVQAWFSKATPAGASDRSLVTEVEYVLVNPVRKRAARPGESVGFDDDFRRRHIQRFGGLALVEPLYLHFERTADGAFDDLDELELQVWKLVPAEKYTAVIEEPAFVVRR